MVAPAPASVSTTTDCPSGARIASAMMRAAVSVEPAGGNGEISVTGRDGNCCAPTEPNQAASAAARSAFIISLPMNFEVYRQ